MKEIVENKNCPKNIPESPPASHRNPKDIAMIHHSPAILRNKHVRVIVKVCEPRACHTEEVETLTNMILPDTSNNQISVKIPLPLQRRSHNRRSVGGKIPHGNASNLLKDTHSNNTNDTGPDEASSSSSGAEEISTGPKISGRLRFKELPTGLGNNYGSDKLVTKTYHFDQVLGPNDSEEQTDSMIMNEFLPSLKEGLNGTLILFGSPKSGKNLRLKHRKPEIVANAIFTIWEALCKQTALQLNTPQLLVNKISISLFPPSSTSGNNVAHVTEFDPIRLDKSNPPNRDTIDQAMHINKQCGLAGPAMDKAEIQHHIYVVNILKLERSNDTMEKNDINSFRVHSRFCVFHLAEKFNDSFQSESAQEEPTSLYDVGQLLRGILSRNKTAPYGNSILGQYLKMYGQNTKTTLISQISMAKEHFLESFNIIQTSAKINHSKKQHIRAPRNVSRSPPSTRQKSSKSQNKIITPPARRCHKRPGQIKHSGTYLENSNLFSSSSEESFQTVIYLNNSEHYRNGIGAKNWPASNSTKYHGSKTNAKCKLIDNKAGIFGTRLENEKPAQAGLDIVKPGKAPLQDFSNHKSNAGNKEISQSPLIAKNHHTLGTEHRRPHIKYNSLNRRGKVESNGEKRQSLKHKVPLIDKNLSRFSSQEHWVDGPGNKEPVQPEIKIHENGKGHGESVPTLDINAGISFNGVHEAKVKEMWIDGPYSPDFLQNIQNKALAAKAKMNEILANEEKPKVPIDETMMAPRTTSGTNIPEAESSKSKIPPNHSLPGMKGPTEVVKEVAKEKDSKLDVFPELEKNILELMNIGSELEDMFQKHKDLENAMDSNCDDSLSELNSPAEGPQAEFGAQYAIPKEGLAFPIISKFGETISIGHGHQPTHRSRGQCSTLDRKTGLELSGSLVPLSMHASNTTTTNMASAMVDKFKPVMKVDPFIIPRYADVALNGSHCNPSHSGTCVMSTFSPQKLVRKAGPGTGVVTKGSNIFVENDIYLAKPPLPPRSLAIVAQALGNNYCRRPSFVHTLMNRSQACAMGDGDKSMTLHSRPRRANQFTCLDFGFNLSDDHKNRAGSQDRLPIFSFKNGPVGFASDFSKAFTSPKNTAGEIGNKGSGNDSVRHYLPQFHCLRNSLSCSCFTDYVETLGGVDLKLLPNHLCEPGILNPGADTLILPDTDLTKKVSSRPALTTFKKPTLTPQQKGLENFTNFAPELCTEIDPKDGGKDINSRGDGSSGYESSPNRTSIDLDNETGQSDVTATKQTLRLNCLKMNLKHCADDSIENVNYYESLDSTSYGCTFKRSSSYSSIKDFAKDPNKLMIETYTVNGTNGGYSNIAHRKVYDNDLINSETNKHTCHKFPIWKLFCC